MASSMTFQFLDVGMGDGTLIQIRPDGQAYDTLILVDFGENRTPFKVGRDDAFTYLRNTIAKNSHDRRASHPYVDYLFITHPDVDHFSSLLALCTPAFPNYPGKELRLGTVYYGGEESEYGKGFISGLGKHVDYGRPKNLQDSYHSPIESGKPKPELSFGDINLFILSANFPTVGNKNKNAKSIVLMLALGPQKVILQGDAESGTEGEILRNYGKFPGFLEVVGHKLGHHGSKGATSTPWVAALKPKAIFASADFVWAHPYRPAIDRVLAGNTLGDKDLWYVCGNDNQYFNNHSAKAVCMNLWYHVFASTGEYLIEEIDGKKNRVWCQGGLTIGVQWALHITPGKVPELWRTDSAVPENATTFRSDAKRGEQL